MVITKGRELRCSTDIRNRKINQVDKFCYLGSWVTKNTRCEKEIKRTDEAKGVLERMKSLLTNTNISIKSKKRMVKAYVWPVCCIAARH